MGAERARAAGGCGERRAGRCGAGRASPSRRAVQARRRRQQRRVPRAARRVDVREQVMRGSEHAEALAQRGCSGDARVARTAGARARASREASDSRR
jgi:hypothetical protein